MEGRCSPGRIPVGPKPRHINNVKTMVNVIAQAMMTAMISVGFQREKVSLCNRGHAMQSR